MFACVVWMDSEHAKLFKISGTGDIQKKELKLHGMKHSNSHQDAHRQHSEEHFFHEIAKEIGSVAELVVFGAGPAKGHFKTHLEKHHHNELGKHLIGVETLDRVTDNQILEAARKYFKKYNTFNSSI